MKRKVLRGLFKVFATLMAMATLYVLFDFMVDFRPLAIQSSYQFKIRKLEVDTPLFLRQDNLVILVIARSAASITELQQATAGLQDAQSQDSDQPEFATNSLRSRHPEYFVSFGIGTNLGCVLETFGRGLREICSQASYDHAGRALKGEIKFRNLAIPDYNFNNDFNTLTIRP